MQTTDIKIGFIKVSELLLLLITPFIILKKNNKYFIYLLTFFTIELVLTFFITFFSTYSQVSKSLMRMPYFISIGRYLELIVCLVLGIITYDLFKKYSSRSKEIISRIVKINLNITYFFVGIYFLVILGVINKDLSVIVYSDYRLRGFFVEGGPYGLMLSFLFILTCNKVSY